MKEKLTTNQLALRLVDDYGFSLMHKGTILVAWIVNRYKDVFELPKMADIYKEVAEVYNLSAYAAEKRIRHAIYECDIPEPNTHMIRRLILDYHDNEVW